jgi:hypothetical protein
MAAANTLVYYDMATITTVKSFISQAHVFTMSTENLNDDFAKDFIMALILPSNGYHIIWSKTI